MNLVRFLANSICFEYGLPSSARSAELLGWAESVNDVLEGITKKATGNFPEISDLNRTPFQSLVVAIWIILKNHQQRLHHGNEFIKRSFFKTGANWCVKCTDDQKIGVPIYSCFPPLDEKVRHGRSNRRLIGNESLLLAIVRNFKIRFSAKANGDL